MEATNPFAEMPQTSESVIALVHRQLTADLLDAAPSVRAAAESTAAITVRSLWGSRVRHFLPTLALREAREFLREQGALMPPAPVEMPEEFGVLPRPDPPGRDVLDVETDVLLLDERDTLSM